MNTRGTPPAGNSPGNPPGDPDEPTGPVIRDKRRIDPVTGQLRHPEQPHPDPTAEREAMMSDDTQRAMAEGDDSLGGAAEGVPGDGAGYLGRHGRDDQAGPGRPSREQTAAAYGVGGTTQPPSTPGAPDETPAPSAGAAGDLHPDTLLAAERLADLQRLQAEYVNYKRRVDRDRDLQRDLVIAGVIDSLLPVLDEIHLARQHGELESGPFAKIAEKLEGILGKHGVERFGQPGDTFDPAVHQALMHTQEELAPGTTETTVVQIMQPGYRMGERVIRPAMVAVADPA